MVTGGENLGCWIGPVARGFAKSWSTTWFFGWSGRGRCVANRSEKTLRFMEGKNIALFQLIFWEMKFDFGG